MEAKNILTITDRRQFREWLSKNCTTATECYLELKRGKPEKECVFYYLDAVEEALCFGWIDTTLCLIDGKRMQKFMPRKKQNSNWTELNKERVRRLEMLGLMTENGRNVLPDMNEDNYKIAPEIALIINENKLADIFYSFPKLYIRIRTSNLLFTKNKLPKQYPTAVQSFIKNTRAGKMYGEWNDYGRLLSDQIPTQPNADQTKEKS